MFIYVCVYICIDMESYIYIYMCGSNHKWMDWQIVCIYINMYLYVCIGMYLYIYTGISYIYTFVSCIWQIKTGRYANEMQQPAVYIYRWVDRSYVYIYLCILYIYIWCIHIIYIQIEHVYVTSKSANMRWDIAACCIHIIFVYIYNVYIHILYIHIQHIQNIYAYISQVKKCKYAMRYHSLLYTHHVHTYITCIYISYVYIYKHIHIIYMHI